MAPKEKKESRKKDVTTLELTPVARLRLDEAAKNLRLKKKDMAELVMSWFANQQDDIQRLIVGHIPASVSRDVAAIVLSRIANPPVEQGEKNQRPRGDFTQNGEVKVLGGDPPPG